MTIQIRSAVYMFCAVALMMGVLSVVMYTSLLQYESMQFQSRLLEKAETTIELLEEAQEVDSTLLRIVDEHTLNKIRDEKVLILNENAQIIYSSIDDFNISYDSDLLEKIKLNRQILYEVNGYDHAAIWYESKDIKRYVFVAAFDTEREKAISIMRKILFWGNASVLIFTILFSYFFAGRALSPLRHLSKQIESLDDHSILQNHRLDQFEGKDEIAQLANRFNELFERLQQGMTERLAFSRYISHELRTPLAVVMNKLELAKSKSYSENEYKLLLDDLWTDHQRMSNLIEQLLTLFRAESTYGNQEMIQSNFLQLLEESIEQIRYSFPSSEIHVHIADDCMDTEVFDFKGNPSLINALLRNLIHNACKYGLQSSVQVRLGVQDGFITFSVSNFAEPIPESERNSLFQPFFRSGATVKKTGTGLGLMLCKSIARLHAGDVKYISGAKEQTFEVKIPSL